MPQCSRLKTKREVWEGRYGMSYEVVGTRAGKVFEEKPFVPPKQLQ